jgi:hypothetical protein
MSLVAYKDDSCSSSSDEEEETPAVPVTAAKRKRRVPLAKLVAGSKDGGGGGAQRAGVTPATEDGGSDSEDDYVPLGGKKRRRTETDAGAAKGLLSFLPAPKHTAPTPVLKRTVVTKKTAVVTKVDAAPDLGPDEADMLPASSASRSVPSILSRVMAAPEVEVAAPVVSLPARPPDLPPERVAEMEREAADAAMGGIPADSRRVRGMDRHLRASLRQMSRDDDDGVRGLVCMWKQAAC